MYVYGGYVADDGSVTDEVWSFSLTSHSWTLVGPRADNFMEGMDLSHVVDPEDAMMFPQMLPDARFSSVLLGRTTVDSFYIIGGAGGESMMDKLSDVAGFSTGTKSWAMPFKVSDNSLVGRYDAAGAVIDDMWACAHGGTSNGVFLDSTVCMFIGDLGLSL